MKKNNKGFTLAELLIVVAIIAVLVAISIPVFTSQLEKAREATDAANIRSAYAEIMAAALSADDGTVPDPITIKLKQQQNDWQNSFDFPSNLTPGDSQPTKLQEDVQISYDETDGCSINIALTKP